MLSPYARFGLRQASTVASSRSRAILSRESHRGLSSQTSTLRSLSWKSSRHAAQWQAPSRRASTFPFMPGWNYWRYTYRQHPIAIPFAVITIIFLTYHLVIVIGMYTNMLKDHANYPEIVSLKLRRALYFTDSAPDPARALKAFIETMRLTISEGMDPVSDEVIGIQLQLSRCLSKFGNPRNAAEIMGEAKDKCMNWIKDNGDKPESAGRRSKILMWACRCSILQAMYYSDTHSGDADKVEECLVWAIETGLRETQRREREGLKEDEQDDGLWMDKDELGSHFEASAHHFESKDQHYFAAQLFLHALMLKQERDCHAVILMNNLAASISQQAPPLEPGITPPSRAQLRDSGRLWARQAMALADSIKAPERTSECVQGCAVARHNLGEFAEMDGNIKEAREMYEQAASLAHAMGFEEGVVNAEAAIRRLNEPSKTSKKKSSWF